MTLLPVVYLSGFPFFTQMHALFIQPHTHPHTHAHTHAHTHTHTHSHNTHNTHRATCAIVWRPLDFSTYFLGVVIVNFLLALSYYVIAKCIYKERPSCREIPSLKAFQTIRPVVYFLLSLAFWGCGIAFYTQSVTNWLMSPADSRNRNKECILLGFYDSHDIWHFASAFALFFSVLMVMSLDDGQEFDVRTKLRVF